MNLYLISQKKNDGYDTFDSAVVAANDEQAERMTHPSYKEWDGTMDRFDSWCNAKDVKAELIGTAIDGTSAGVICASFNAG